LKVTTIASLPGPVKAPQSTCAIGLLTSLPQTKRGWATWSAVDKEQSAVATRDAEVSPVTCDPRTAEWIGPDAARVITEIAAATKKKRKRDARGQSCRMSVPFSLPVGRKEGKVLLLLYTRARAEPECLPPPREV
jgi:hypothetical protein